MKQIRTRFTKEARVTTGLKRQAILDTLYDEAMEDPYRGDSIATIVSDLAKRHKLSFDEMVYLKKKSDKESIGTVEKTR